jgi:hypothetical protein
MRYKLNDFDCHNGGEYSVSKIELEPLCEKLIKQVKYGFDKEYFTSPAFYTSVILRCVEVEPEDLEECELLGKYDTGMMFSRSSPTYKQDYLDLADYILKKHRNGKIK